MSDGDKSMNFQLIFNQCVATYNILLGINSIFISDP